QRRPEQPAFYDLTVCFTGKLGMTRHKAREGLATLGVNTVLDVDKAVKLLVVGEVDPCQLAVSSLGRAPRAVPGGSAVDGRRRAEAGGGVHSKSRRSEGV